MLRREFISKSTRGAGLLAIGAMVLPGGGCSDVNQSFNKLFSKGEVSLLNELAEIIIPATDSPGGKAAKVGEFIASMVQECYSSEDQEKLKNGLKAIDEKSKETFGKEYLKCDVKQQTELTAKLDKEEETYFPDIKKLVVSGYLSSEIGATKFLKYPQIPGRYEGCTSVRPW